MVIDSNYGYPIIRGVATGAEGDCRDMQEFDSELTYFRAQVEALKAELAKREEHIDISPVDNCGCPMCRDRRELADAKETIECFEAMKEGFTIRANDYESKLQASEAARNTNQSNFESCAIALLSAEQELMQTRARLAQCEGELDKARNLALAILEIANIITDSSPLSELRALYALLGNDPAKLEQLAKVVGMAEGRIDRLRVLDSDQEWPQTEIDELEYSKATCNHFRWGVAAARQDIRLANFRRVLQEGR